MPNYIIRLDDACPQMHTANWQRVEDILDKYKIVPLIAVIPDNKDQSLFYNIDENFWTTTIPKWQAKGWELALHGYKHIYTPTTKKSLVPFKQKSEFTGFSYEVQKEKIQKGLNILNANNIYPNIFIAPGHAFDEITIKVLLQETNINIISDGISTKPFLKYGINWIPQQIWSFKNMPFGYWTICLHPNTMTNSDFVKMENWLKNNSKQVIKANSVSNIEASKKNIFDIIFEKLFWLAINIKK
jgi:Uncharacterized protein conserved in bacteria (DUF2334)